MLLLLVIVIVGPVHRMAGVDHCLVVAGMLVPQGNLINGFAKKVLRLSRPMPRGTVMARA